MRSRRIQAWRRRAGVACLLLAVPGWAACGDGPEGESPEKVASSSAGSTSASLLENPPEPPPEQAQAVSVVELGYNHGDARAPVYVVEFSDFGCTYCRQFHLQTWPELRKDFVAEGKVGWKFIPFVSGMFEHSRAATTAALCAENQGGFEPYALRLFEDQRSWKTASDPSQDFLDYARELELDLARFRQCVQEDRRGKEIDEANLAATQLGIRATPTFYVDGYPIQGALPEALFREIFEIQLGEREPSR